ncbi:MAG TPA: tRNA (adenosine(37)-N6)-threonylcarbamoyltransferase complex dimerization subunit type 1 TsaB [Gemmatimonadales bacterium]|nr:tRNA (adenosine(37)-N6)-threonylcarbamoyltransferase complex dimerization subunit type 1 TsaB [Gemmatimonadales bacterium]
MLLAIETATDCASVALGLPGADPLEENVTGARRHAAALLPLIQTLLRRAGASLDDVSGIALSDGPGSFTGLRVGASVAKALVHARGIPLWVAPSLLVRAAGVARENALVLAVTGALRGEVYAAAYRFLPDRVHTELAPSVRHPGELMKGPTLPEIVVGEAPADIIAALESWTGRRVIGPPDGSPHAGRLLELVERPGGARRVEAPAAWEPVYGRPAEAQARWEKVHGRPLPDSVGSPG